MNRPLVTRQGVDAAYGIPDDVSRLGAAIEGPNLPKRPLSYVYKAPRRSLLYWSIVFLASSSRALLRFFFAIYSFSRVNKQPDSDGVHVLSTGRLQLSPRIHR